MRYSPIHHTMIRLPIQLAKYRCNCCTLVWYKSWNHRLYRNDSDLTAKYFIMATSSGKVLGSKRTSGQSYASASELPLSLECQADFSACTRKDGPKYLERSGAKAPRPTCGQLRRQSNGTGKYGRDHGPAQDASLNLILTLNDPRYGHII